LAARDYKLYWQTLAKSLLPKLLEEYLQDDPDGNTMMFFFDVLPAFRDSIENKTDATTIAICEFSEWCSWQSEKDLWNSAGVAFWEHIFDDWVNRKSVACWIKPKIFDEVKGLWEFRLGERKLAQISELIQNEGGEKRKLIRNPKELDLKYLSSLEFNQL